MADETISGASEPSGELTEDSAYNRLTGILDKATQAALASGSVWIQNRGEVGKATILGELIEEADAVAHSIDSDKVASRASYVIRRINKLKEGLN